MTPPKEDGREPEWVGIARHDIAKSLREATRRAKEEDWTGVVEVLLYAHRRTFQLAMRKAREDVKP